MPCWEVREVSIEMKIVDKKYTESAIKALGWTMRGTEVITSNRERFSIVSGKVTSPYLTIQQLTEVRNKLQQQTSIEIIRAAAVRNRWGAIQVSPTKITLKRA